MSKMNILSWNVNGIRAVCRKKALDWFFEEQPDVLCLQETKCQEDQIPKEIADLSDYKYYFASAEKKGYSGVAILTKQEPKKVEIGIEIEEYDSEGRIISADYGNFILFNVYFPNGKASPERLRYKLAFYNEFLAYCDSLIKKKKKVIFCGDVNTAHKEIDLARPKENENTSGFLPEEREWIDKVIDHNYYDTFRMFNTEPDNYSWWDYKTRARDRNIGWRIDYFFASSNIKNNISGAFIRNDIMGSDHCPIGITLEI